MNASIRGKFFTEIGELELADADEPRDLFIYSLACFSSSIISNFNLKFGVWDADED